LDGGVNAAISTGLLVWALVLGVRRGESFVALLSRRWDARFVGVLRGWVRRLRVRPPQVD
jgi:hypothetical protein